MFEYLQKYNKIPKEIRDKVSSPQAMIIVNDLENKYGIELAAVIMKIMIKEVDIHNIEMFFVREYGLTQEKAKSLSEELKNKVLLSVQDYLGIKNEKAKLGVSSFGRDEALEKRENFFFSAEDEEEIKKLSQKVNGFSQISLSDDDYTEKINRIIKKAEIRLGSEVLLERFRKILKTHLKGVRDRIETKQALMKSFEGGGLAFDEKSTRKILLIAKKVLEDKNIIAPIAPLKIKVQEDSQEKEVSKKQNVSSFRSAGTRDLDYDLSQLKNPIKKEEFKKDRPKLQEERKKILPQDILELDLEHELSPPPPKVEPKKEIVETKKDEIKISTPQKEIIKPKESIRIIEKKEKKVEGMPAEIKKEDLKEIEASKPSIKFRKPIQMSGKKRMDDVKHIPRVMTPIDELKYMNLVSFRRLGDVPAKAVEKVIDKIKLLEEEKYSKRVEGIKAWRQSPINKLYLKIGQLSINERKPIKEIINVIKNKGEDYLTEEEFDAVMDLNKKIRF